MSITVNLSEAVEEITATIVDGEETITATINELPRGVAGPTGATGATGPTGAQGPAGPNSVTSSTTTTLNGILKGNGSVVGTATAGTDYLTPTGNGSNLLFPTGILVEATGASISASGENCSIFTTGDNCSIFTSGASSNIYTQGGGYIETSGTFKIKGGVTEVTTISGTQTADRDIAFPDASGTVALTTSNVATATALQTARTIFGQSFNGTANIGGGTITLANNLTTSGNFALTLTTTAATNVTLPTTGTLATLAGTETLTNKTLTSPTLNNPTAATASTTTPALIASGPTSAVDTIQIRGTTTASYSSIGLMDNGNVQRGSFGYGGSTAGSFASSVFFNSSSGIPMAFGAGGSEKMRISSAGGLSIGTTTDAGATNLLVAGRIVSGGVVRLKGYTFATLPAGTQGDKAFITDGAASPTFRANAAGGGSTVTEVFYNGTNWINS